MKNLILFISLLLSVSLRSQVQVFGAVASGQLESTAAQRYIDVAPITDNTQKSAIRRLVADLSGVPNGSYSVSNTFFKYDFIYPFLGGTSVTCSYNLRDPSTQFTVVNGANAPTFSAAGYIGSTTSYIRTGFTPSTALAMATSNVHVSIRVASSIAQATAASDLNAIDAGARSVRIRVRGGSDVFDATNGSTSPTIATTNASTSTTYVINSRTTSTAWSVYQDGVSVGSNVTSNSATLPTVEIPFGATNNSGTFTPIGVARTYNFATGGKGLSATEAANLFSAEDFFNTTTLGR